MQAERETNIIAVKMDNNEDLMASLEGLCKDQMVKSGLVLFGIGMIRDFELGYFNGKEYEFTEFQEPAELVALHGSIATVDEAPSIHLHAGVATRDLALKGGHLRKATVNGLVEIGIIKLTDVELTRWKNDTTGFTELLVSKASDSTHHVRRVPHDRRGIGRRSMDLDLD
jgi:predicted DNA-binding protein with PD1-like motif